MSVLIAMDLCNRHKASETIVWLLQRSVLGNVEKD